MCRKINLSNGNYRVINARELQVQVTVMQQLLIKPLWAALVSLWSFSRNNIIISRILTQMKQRETQRVTPALCSQYQALLICIWISEELYPKSKTHNHMENWVLVYIHTQMNGNASPNSISAGKQLSFAFSCAVVRTRHSWSMVYHACQIEIIPLWQLLSELHAGPCLLWNNICLAVPQLRILQRF